MPAEALRVEVVYARAQCQWLVTVELTPPATALDAVQAAARTPSFPRLNRDQLHLAVWGRPVEVSHVVQTGDRVEILRPLAVDPRAARRRLAAEGRVMGRGAVKSD